MLGLFVPFSNCWHEKPRWFASWRFDEDWMKLFWTILKPLPLEWSLHWWRKWFDDIHGDQGW